MPNFLYPLPKEYYDQTTDDRIATQYYSRSFHGAHTYGPYNGSTGHGTGKLDLNCKEGTPVRAMTDGIVIRAGKDNTSSYRSMQILVQGDEDGYHMDSQGYIGGDGSIGGKLIIRYYHIGNFQFKIGDHVKQGDIIGYVGDPAVGSAGAHLHLDFSTNLSGALIGPQTFLKDVRISDIDNLNLTQEQKDGLKRWAKDEWKPGRCWEVIVSLATWKEASSNSNISVDVSQIKYVQNMNQDAVNCYASKILSDNWIGKYPETENDLINNIQCRGVRYATAICSMELNFDGFSNVAYSKLLRAKMIGEKHTGNTMKEWFENLHPNQFANKSKWLAKTNLDLTLAQLVYKNLKYPELYGSELSSDEEIKKRIIYAYQQIPIYNLSPMSYYPHAFYVNYNTKTKQDEGDSGGAGNLLYYRQQNGDMTYFNSKVLQ